MQGDDIGVLSGELPWPEGELKGPDVYDPHIDLDSGKWTFTGLSKEYALYSAEVLNFLGLSFDPVALCWEENSFPMNETPIVLTSPRPVLRGLPAPLDSTVYACPLPYAETLFRALDRMTVCRDGAAYDSVRQVIPIVDWPLLDKISVAPSKPPTVNISVYGVTGGGSLVYWKKPTNPWTEPWTLVKRLESKKNERRK